MVTKFSSLYLGPGLVICCLFILLSFLKNLPKTCIKCSFRVDYLSIGFLQRNLLKQSKNCKEHTYEHEHISHRFRCNKLIPTLAAGIYISGRLKPKNKKRYACNLNVQTCFLKEASILQNPHSKNSVTISRLLSYFNRFFPNFEIGLISLTTLRDR